jgi:serine/threonine protein kinase
MQAKITHIIGKGKFGTVFQGDFKKEKVAIKTETVETGLVKHEAMILNYLYHNRCHNIPLVYWYGLFEDRPTLVMTLFEISLFDYVDQDLHFCPAEKILKSLLSNIKHIHSAFVLHRDIKPQNIMFKNKEMFLVDFGLSATYIDDNKRHVLEKKDFHILGTPKYASINLHDGFSASRRDDVISLIYTFLFVFNKSLPWENVRGLSNEYEESHILHPKNQERLKKKGLDLIIREVDSFSPSFLEFIRKSYDLRYDETPLYEFTEGVYGLYG